MADDMSVWDNYECNGQISLSDIYEVGVIGICDDPICTNCGYEFNMIEDKRYNMKSEIDCERCPKCKVRLDWRRWHRCNDEEGAANESDSM